MENEVKQKLKTKSGAKKRFKVTASGKVIYKRANLRHILTSKAKGRKRKLRKHAALNLTDGDRIQRLMPYA